MRLRIPIAMLEICNRETLQSKVNICKSDVKIGDYADSLEMCSLWQKISISYNSCRFSVVIASVGFNIDRVTTQHTLKCAKNCSDNKVSYNCPSNSYQIFCKPGYNSENSVFFST